MDVVKTIAEVRGQVAKAHKEGKVIGLVPTMGALHAGHASLIDAARGGCGFVVVSIFVNPMQFGPNEDLSRYPRTPQHDIDLCRSRGANVVFMPDAHEIYPAVGNLTQVSISRLGDRLCGASRPGHFTGVCTVVSKLFNIIQPDKAFFGAKDFQQAAVIRQMTADLNFPIEIVVCPIVRESDGLAMSSRNVYLSKEHRLQAVALSASLKMAAEMIRNSHPPSADVIEAIRRRIHSHAPDGTIDYVEVVDPFSLMPVEETNRCVCIALAVKFGSTRLIDNVVVEKA